MAALTGGWSGQYAYDDEARPTVPFNASVHEIDGVLDGEIVEPNTFGDPGASELFSTISGWRAGAGVHFVKRYDGAGGADHAVLYDGTLSADSTRISGRWKIGAQGGPFSMMRDLPTGDREVERIAQA